MLSTLVCTMFLTLCVDAGWKPTEDGGEVYVIQVRPEQGNQMIQSEGFITCGIPDGVKEVRVQFRSDTLASKPTTPLFTTPKLVTDKPEPVLGKPVTPKPTPREPVAPDKESPSYLATSIISWIVSAGLLAMFVFLGWIHLDIRRRYQTLLDRTLANQPEDALSQADPLPYGILAGTSRLHSTSSPEKEVVAPEVLPPIATSAISKTASASEAPSQKSTSVEPEAETENIEVVGLIEADLDETQRLLQNTNRAIAQASQGAGNRKIHPEEAETVYELPETSDDEPLEEEEDEDDEKNWEGVD